MTIANAFLVLTTPAPKLSEARANEILQKHFGIGGELKPLVSERDQNFAVHDESGHRWILKIANSAEESGVTDFQSKALMHIATTEPDLPVPRIRLARGGEAAAKVTSDDGRMHTARVLSWQDGIPMRQAGGSSANAATLGRLLARLGRSLKDYDHPAAGYYLLWDLKHSDELTSLLDSIPDKSLREMCRSRLQRFDEYVNPMLQDLRSQVIYNDLNPSNVLVDVDSPEVVTGVIDFGDMVKSPLIADVAVGAAYQCSDGTDPLAEVVDFVAGYNEVTALNLDELRLLPDLIMIRHVMTIVITNWRATRYPENSQYILRNESRARATIEGLARTLPSEVTNRFVDACENR